MEKWNVGGRDVELAPITLTDLDDLGVHIKGQIAEKMNALARNMDADTKRFLVKTAYDDVKDSIVNFDCEAIDRATQTPKGVVYLLYLSAKKKTPSITFDEIDGSVTVDNFQAAREITNRLAGLRQPSPSEPEKKT